MYIIDKSFNDIIKIDSNDCEELKEAFLNVINGINNENLMVILREFPKYKPIIAFKTLYYILEEFKESDILDNDFAVMRRYLEKDIDIFMLINYLKKI